MKFKELEELLLAYVDRPFVQNLFHYNIVMDFQLVLDTLTFFIETAYEDELMGGSDINLNDIHQVENAYAVTFPMYFLEYGEEAPLVFFILHDFYGFLRKRKEISEQTYSKVLNIFTKRQETFFEGMNNSKFWSKEKKEFIAEMNSPENYQGSLDKLVKNLLVEQGAKSRDNKVIAVDFGGKKSKNTKSKEGGFQIRIDIKGFKPPIWRRVVVPAGMTFLDLHIVIQNIFAWENYHLFVFEVGNERIAMQSDDNDFSDSGFGIFQEEDAAKVIIDDYLMDFKKINYTYDFGDDWEHLIKLEKILTKEEVAAYNQLPICIKGKGDSPLEDSRMEELYEVFDIEVVNEELYQSFFTE